VIAEIKLKSFFGSKRINEIALLIIVKLNNDCYEDVSDYGGYFKPSKGFKNERLREMLN